MAKTKDYQHFCPAARALELIGEKWSLLVVRDLLRGPQRFSDLERYVGGISPKWLTQRLRYLESEGIVERDSQDGRREVWYRLTPKGRDLAPVIRSLIVWGFEHAMRPPRDDEPIFPESVLGVLATLLNERERRPKMPVAWRFHFEDRTLLLTFDGQGWSASDADAVAPADLDVRVGTRDWVDFLLGPEDQRPAIWRRIELRGAPAHAAEFRRLFRDRPTRAGFNSPAASVVARK